MYPPGAKEPSRHVKPVVDAFVQTYGIENFYIFGVPKPREGEDKSDVGTTWMFFRPEKSMKLIDAIKKNGLPYKVPKCSRDELLL